MSLHRENARLRRRIMANATESDAAASGVAKMAEALAEARSELERLQAENAALKREAHTWSKAAEIYAASEAKLCEARLAELRYVAEAAQTMRTELAGPARADALYDLREWALNRQRADVLNDGPNAELTGAHAGATQTQGRR